MVNSRRRERKQTFTKINPHGAAENGESEYIREKASQLRRGADIQPSAESDKKVRGQLKQQKELYDQAAVSAAKATEWLLPEEPGYLEPEEGGVEHTWNMKQEDISRNVESGASRKAFDLMLPGTGPYKPSFTHNGRHLLMAGERGHFAVAEWQRHHVVTEQQVADTTRDAVFLHNENFFATAQKKCAYIYDKRGLEVHRLSDHTEPVLLDFLPRHFLLVSASKTGVLRYQDTSDGRLIAQHRTKAGRILALRQNPSNSVMCLGHHNGSMSMWTPNMGHPVVKMLTHRGPLRDVTFDKSGTYMVTAGADAEVRVWDLRMYRNLHSYFAAQPPSSIDASQRGLLAVSWGSRVQVWKDAIAQKAKAPYMNHRVANGAGTVKAIRFCPYEDVLGIGHSQGVTTMLVPGAGEPNFDAFVANPFESKKQRQEQEVAKLMDKLRPDMIQLDASNVGKVKREPAEVQKERQKEALRAELQRKRSQLDAMQAKRKKKGKNKPSKRARKRHDNIIEQSKIEKTIASQASGKVPSASDPAPEASAQLPPGLKRFAKHVKR